MKKILNYIIVGIFISLAYNCEEDATDNSVNYVTFESAAKSGTIDVGSGGGNIDVTVYTGNTTGSNRSIGVVVDTEASTADPSAYSVPSSVTIPGGDNEGILSVQFNESGLDFAPVTVVVNFMNEAGLYVGDSVTISAALVCPPADAGELTIEITTDNWPDETTWSLTDSSGTVIASGGPYNNPADDFSTITANATVGAGTYTMTLNDAFGDGGSSFAIMNGCGQVLASGAVAEFTTSSSFVID